MTEHAAKNTDRELYREPDKGNGTFYSDSIHVTEGGGIGMNCGGHVIVMPISGWHAAAKLARGPVGEEPLTARLEKE